MEDVLRVAIHDFQIMISDIGTQENGLVAIIDFKNFGMGKMKDMTPIYLKKLAVLLQVFEPVSSHPSHLWSFIVSIIVRTGRVPDEN